MQLWAISTFAIAYGFYRVGQCNKEKSGEKLEERKLRFAMAPVLQAEEDRWYAAREQAILKREADIMKNVDGWEVGKSTYFTDRWVPRCAAPLDKNLKK
jgi:NADH dehydrogenase (ubiquinone) 1 alpha subcomplex subunit 13